MAINKDKIDDAALALLYLTLHDGYRAWKGFDWDVLGRLHDKGMIGDPVGKVKSVVFTGQGLERAKKLFEEMFEEKGEGEVIRDRYDTTTALSGVAPSKAADYAPLIRPTR